MRFDKGNRLQLAEAAFTIVAKVDCPHEVAAEIVASALSRVGTDSPDPKTGHPQFDRWDEFLPKAVVSKDRSVKLVKQCVVELILTPNECTEMVFDMTCTELVERVVTNRQAYVDGQKAANKRPKAANKRPKVQEPEEVKVDPAAITIGCILFFVALLMGVLLIPAW